MPELRRGGLLRDDGTLVWDSVRCWLLFFHEVKQLRRMRCGNLCRVRCERVLELRSGDLPTGNWSKFVYCVRSGDLLSLDGSLGDVTLPARLLLHGRERRHGAMCCWNLFFGFCQRLHKLHRWYLPKRDRPDRVRELRSHGLLSVCWAVFGCSLSGWKFLHWRFARHGRLCSGTLFPFFGERLHELQC